MTGTVTLPTWVLLSILWVPLILGAVLLCAVVLPSPDLRQLRRWREGRRALGRAVRR